MTDLISCGNQWWRWLWACWWCNKKFDQSIWLIHSINASVMHTTGCVINIQLYSSLPMFNWIWLEFKYLERDHMMIMTMWWKPTSFLVARAIGAFAVGALARLAILAAATVWRLHKGSRWSRWWGHNVTMADTDCNKELVVAVDKK